MEGEAMDVIEAILGRRSCRRFAARPVEQEKIDQILDCAIFAPSAANKQPWEFVVTSNHKYKIELKAVVDATKDKLAARSGWKWLPAYQTDFLLEALVLIVVTGDPERNGAEQFLDQPGHAYEHGCCAAIQNMLLAAHGLGLGTLWFSLFEKDDVRRIFAIPANRDPLAIICLGYPESVGAAPARKPAAEKVRYLD
jgi:nitroreductase